MKDIEGKGFKLMRVLVVMAIIAIATAMTTQKQWVVMGMYLVCAVLLSKKNPRAAIAGMVSLGALLVITVSGLGVIPWGPVFGFIALMCFMLVLIQNGNMGVALSIFVTFEAAVTAFAFYVAAQIGDYRAWTGVFVLTLIILGIFYAVHSEKKAWNGGFCPACRRKWRYFDTDSQGGRGYKCDTCLRVVWISWPVDRKIIVKCITY